MGGYLDVGEWTQPQDLVRLIASYRAHALTRGCDGGKKADEERGKKNRQIEKGNEMKRAKN